MRSMSADFNVDCCCCFQGFCFSFVVVESRPVERLILSSLLLDTGCRLLPLHSQLRSQQSRQCGHESWIPVGIGFQGIPRNRIRSCGRGSRRGHFTRLLKSTEHIMLKTVIVLKYFHGIRLVHYRLCQQVSGKSGFQMRVQLHREDFRYNRFNISFCKSMSSASVISLGKRGGWGVGGGGGRDRGGGGGA